MRFNPGFVQKHGLLEGRKVSEGKATGVGGSVTQYTGKLEWFELGGHKFVEPTVSFSKGPGDGADLGEVTGGDIGNGFLSRFTLFIDYPNMRMAFVPRKKTR